MSFSDQASALLTVIFTFSYFLLHKYSILSLFRGDSIASPTPKGGIYIVNYPTSHCRTIIGKLWGNNGTCKRAPPLVKYKFFAMLALLKASLVRGVGGDTQQFGCCFQIMTNYSVIT